MTPRWHGIDWLNQGAEAIAHNPEHACALLKTGLRQAPDEGIGWFNLGLALHQRGRIAAAIRAYRHSLVFPTNHAASIRKNLGQDLLLLGAEPAAGWQEREVRPSMAHFRGFETQLGPSWRGFHDPRGVGQELLVLSEQGLGDTLMFCRFAQHLHNVGWPIRLLCQPALVDLLRECSGLARIASIDTSLTAHSGRRWVPLMSLPHRLRWSSAPWPAPQLSSTALLEQRRQFWRQSLERQPGHRLIGLHWQGNPKHEQSLYTRGRSMSLNQWSSLAAWLPAQTELVALQKGPGLEQWNQHTPLPFVRGQERFNASLSMLDSAAVVSQCDLVISADSGVVHLAGCLGVPTWVALRHIPDWRWGLTGSTTPWYPSLRLFRQPQQEAWRAVVCAIGQALKQHQFL